MEGLEQDGGRSAYLAATARQKASDSESGIARLPASGLPIRLREWSVSTTTMPRALSASTKASTAAR